MATCYYFGVGRENHTQQCSGVGEMLQRQRHYVMSPSDLFPGGTQGTILDAEDWTWTGCVQAKLQPYPRHYHFGPWILLFEVCLQKMHIWHLGELNLLGPVSNPSSWWFAGILVFSIKLLLLSFRLKSHFLLWTYKFNFNTTPEHVWEAPEKNPCFPAGHNNLQALLVTMKTTYKLWKLGEGGKEGESLQWTCASGYIWPRSSLWRFVLSSSCFSSYSELSQTCSCPWLFSCTAKKAAWILWHPR